MVLALAMALVGSAAIISRIFKHETEKLWSSAAAIAKRKQLRSGIKAVVKKEILCLLSIYKKTAKDCDQPNK